MLPLLFDDASLRGRPTVLALGSHSDDIELGAGGTLLHLVERYPELKSDRVFQGLMTELEGTENRIAVARRNFNEAVKQYNGRVQFIPGSLVASMRGYRPKPFFEAAPGAETAPKVKF